MLTDWLEIVAVSTAFLAVILQWREHRATWHLVIVSSALYALVFYRAGLPWDALLQFCFIALAARGLFSWNRRATATSFLPAPTTIHSRPRPFHIRTILAASLGSVLLAAITIYLRSGTSLPVAWPVALGDAGIFVFSLIAVGLTERKVIEVWWYWIAIDLIASALYLSRDLVLTSILYAAYIPLALIGFLTWNGRLHAVVQESKPC